MRTAASVTKVECCALVYPCPHISTRGRRLEVVRAEPDSEREETEENEKRSDCS